MRRGNRSVVGRRLAYRVGAVVGPRTMLFFSNPLTKQSAANNKAKSPSSGLAPVRCWPSIALTNAMRGKRIAARPLISTARTPSKTADDRRQVRRGVQRTKSVCHDKPACWITGLEFACKLNRSAHHPSAFYSLDRRSIASGRLSFGKL